MIANLENLQRHLSQPPATWNGSMNYRDASPERLYADGWREVVTPEYNTDTQKLSDEWELINDIVTKQVIDLTPEQIAEIEDAKIPIRAKKWQVREALIQLYGGNIIATIDTAIKQMPDPPKTLILQMWEHREELSRTNENVIMLGQALNIDINEVWKLANTID